MIADKDNELNKDLIEDEEGVSDPYERRERGRGRKRKKKRRRKRRSKKRSIPICGVIKLRYYQQYFEATTSEVIQKLIWSILFFSGQFNKVASKKIDLYGPFWILCTNVLSLTLSQNIYSYLSRPEGQAFQYTIQYVPKAFSVVYTFGLGMPLCFNFILRMFGCRCRYWRAIMIFGYAQTINIIMLFCCCIPYGSAQSFFIIYGAVHSSAFIFFTFRREIEGSGISLKYGVIGLMALGQFTLILIYKMYFFGHLYEIDEIRDQVLPVKEAPATSGA